MKQPIFRGTCTALVTPFHETGIDFAALDRLLETQLEAGVEALVIGGTTGGRYPGAYGADGPDRPLRPLLPGQNEVDCGDRRQRHPEGR